MAIRSDDDYDSSPKQPFKRLQLALKGITEDAIPTHLSLLEQHKLRIEKLQQSHDWDNLLRENMKAARTVKQLKVYIKELDGLQSQIRCEDACKVQEIILPVRDKVVQAVTQFTQMHSQDIDSGKTSISSSNHHSNYAHEDVNQDMHSNVSPTLDVQVEVQSKKSTLLSWNMLKRELFDLSSMSNTLASIVMGHKEQINRIENNVGNAQECISKGNRDLAKAAALKAGLIPIASAMIGTAVGGPLGLLAGLKLGGVALAIGGGIAGYAGGKVIQKKAYPYPEFEMIKAEEEKEDNGLGKRDSKKKDK